MSSLKEVRNRITSVRSTQQITSAMKMVAASKLRRAQNAILSLRPYAQKLNEMMKDLSAEAAETEAGIFAEERKPENILLITIASNRGLCGAFNSNVIKAASDLIREQYASQHRKGNVHIMTIGKKASDFFGRRKFPIYGVYNDIFDALTFEKAAILADLVMVSFGKKEYDRIEIIYNQFKNAAVQRLVVEQYLPLIPPESKNAGNSQQSAYLFEPSKPEILNDLIPRSLRIQLYKAILDSFASEHGARMTAMHKATDNAKDLLRELQLTYNKARQATITNEILEIVSGAEALKDQNN